MAWKDPPRSLNHINCKCVPSPTSSIFAQLMRGRWDGDGKWVNINTKVVRMLSRNASGEPVVDIYEKAPDGNFYFHKRMRR